MGAAHALGCWPHAAGGGAGPWGCPEAAATATRSPAACHARSAAAVVSTSSSICSSGERPISSHNEVMRLVASCAHIAYCALRSRTRSAPRPAASLLPSCCSIAISADGQGQLGRMGAWLGLGGPPTLWSNDCLVEPRHAASAGTTKRLGWRSALAMGCAGDEVTERERGLREHAQPDSAGPSPPHGTLPAGQPSWLQCRCCQHQPARPAAAPMRLAQAAEWAARAASQGQLWGARRLQL